jgi:hypothetical protein
LKHFVEAAALEILASGDWVLVVLVVLVIAESFDAGVVEETIAVEAAIARLLMVVETSVAQMVVQAALDDMAF